MVFLINASNLKNGGGLQVAQSICGEFANYTQHHFVIVLSTYINDEDISSRDNIETYHYNLPHDLKTVLTGRDAFLDGMVAEKRVDAVLTVFGPSIWRPKVAHLCGFARAQLLLTNPNGNHNPFINQIKQKLIYKIWTWGFRRSSKVFYTENAYISNMLPNLIKGAKVYTVTNYYNQVFDQPQKWKRSIDLNCLTSNFSPMGVRGLGRKVVTMLTVSSTASHKNLGIMVPVAEILEKNHSGFDFRFVLTCNEAPFVLPEQLRDHFVFVGKVEVAECPSLYEQADMMCMPTLMECFTATYPEAMRMGVPIVTTDLEFARELCGEAACYYSAVDAKAAASAIYKVATDVSYRNHLVDNGKKQLLTYDNYEQRAEKLVKILEEITVE